MNPSAPSASGGPSPDEARWAWHWIQSVTDRALMLLDASGRVLWWNRGATRLLGYPPEAVIGQPLEQLWAGIAPTGPALAELLQQAGDVEGMGAEAEVELVRRDGRPFWGWVNVTCLELGVERRFGVAIRDLTERKQAEAALQQREARYRTTLQGIGDAVIVTDAAGCVELLNPVAEALTGWTTADARGRPLEEVFVIRNEQTRQPVESPVSRVLREGIVVGLANHTLLVRRDGREIPIADSGAPIRDDHGRITGVVLVFRDQTRERYAERLQEAERFVLERLARGMPLYEWMPLVCVEYEKLHPEAICSILLLENGRLRHGAAPHLPPEYNQAVDGLRIGPAVGSCGTAAYRNDIVIVSDTFTDPLWEIGRDLARQYQLRACWSVPIRGRRGDVLGTFAIYYRTVRTPQPEEIERLQRWAELTSLAIERHRDLQQLAESEEKFRLLAEENLAGVYLIGADGRFLYVNDALAQIARMTREEMLALPSALEVVVPEDRGMVAENLRRRLSGETVKMSYDFHYLRKDGSRGIVQVLGRRLIFRGQPAVLGTALDITEQRQAEQALKQREEFLQSLIRSIDGIVWEADSTTFRFTYVSPRAESILGYPLQQWYDQPDFWASHLHPDDRESAVSFCQAATRDGRDHEFEYRMIAADGRVVWVHDVVTVETDAAGQPIRLRGIIMDITEQKQLQAQLSQLQKMEAVGRLAGGIAHDFNNLLTVILGYGQMLLERTPQGRPEHDLLRSIHDAAERAAALTQQLLAFSRQTIVEPKLIHLDEFIRNTEKMLRRIIGEDIVLATVVSGHLPPVRIDPGQLNQVILNLAVNARDAMPHGGRLTIECRPVELNAEYCRLHPPARPGRYVLLAVSDTGAGMTPEVMARIFEPFFTTKEVGKGTGLGLSVVYGIVHQAGGHIQVYSELGQGSTFKVYLPVAEDERAVALPVVEDPPGGNETILLVEDDEAVRQLARASLETYGYTVLAAADAAQALRLVEERHGQIDLLVTDVVMPQMSGRELVEQLRQRFPTLKVLYVSGYTDDVILRLGLAQAEVTFLQKPFTPTTLARKVRDVLDQKQ